MLVLSVVPLFLTENIVPPPQHTSITVDLDLRILCVFGVRVLLPVHVDFKPDTDRLAVVLCRRATQEVAIFASIRLLHKVNQ